MSTNQHFLSNIAEIGPRPFSRPRRPSMGDPASFDVSTLSLHRLSRVMGDPRDFFRPVPRHPASTLSHSHGCLAKTGSRLMRPAETDLPGATNKGKVLLYSLWGNLTLALLVSNSFSCFFVCNPSKDSKTFL